jgi:dTDP-4-amino-4,6-dideoxygalactose transaminase
LGSPDDRLSWVRGGAAAGHTAYATTTTITAVVLRVEAEPLFVDRKPNRSVLSVAHCSQRLEEGRPSRGTEGPFRTVIAVHLYGEAWDLVPLQAICAHH